MSSNLYAPLAGADAISSASTVERPAALPQTWGELIDGYMSAYCGRDGALPYRLREWQARIGKLPIASFTDDDLFYSLEAIAAAPARIFTSYDTDGKPIHRLKGGPARTAPLIPFMMH